MRSFRYVRIMMQRLASYTLFLFVLLSGVAEAAHLVGGYISYECQGNNDYRITLRVYRDCGSGGAAFDAQSNIAIYDINNNLIQQLSVPKGPTIPVSTNSTGNPCLTPPPGLCTEYADYTVSVNLPPIVGGYTITHQRCCRNASIANVNNSGSLGNTYTIRVPSQDTTCNSSPQFQSVAPIVLCVNDPLNVQIDAIDADGDSLYFEFCEILEGGGQGGGGGCNAVVPNPPCPPPYTPIAFIPPSTPQAPLPGISTIRIDSANGTLSGTPNNSGQYVVGVCVTEYRNGVPLSTARLDYQFNIVNCVSNIVADMLTSAEDPTILCDGRTVQFENQSTNFNHLRWDFGVPGIAHDTSNLPNPIYTYPDTGSYTVTLIVNPGWQCSDSATFTFHIQEAVNASLSWSGVPCFEVQGIQWQATGNWVDSTTFNWNFGGTGNPIGWGQLNPPPVTWSTPGWKTVTFTASWPPGCQIVLTDSIEISSLTANVDAGPDQSIPEGGFALLSATGGSEFYWYSDVPARYSGRYEQGIQVWPEDDTTTFYVIVRDALGCEGIDSVRVFLIPEIFEDPIVQNFISPNGDGRNDFLDLSNLLEGQAAELVILNRWGNEVYAKAPYLNDWSGEDAGGDPLPDGTYYFLLRRGNAIIYKGPVSILRGE